MADKPTNEQIVAMLESVLEALNQLRADIAELAESL